MIYNVPALDSVNFSLKHYTPKDVDKYPSELVVDSVPALDAVDFTINVYNIPEFNLISFELATPPYYGILKRWTGSIWIRAKLMTRQSIWETKKLKRLDNVGWEEIDITGN
jgi:hypothetical protein